MHYQVLRLQVLFMAILLGLAAPRLDISLLPIIIVVSLWLMLRHKQILTTLLLLIGFFVGQLRGFSVWQELDAYKLILGSKVTIQGLVVDDADYGFKRQVEFYLENPTINGQQLPGRVKIGGFGQIEVKRGDKVAATGKLRSGFSSYQAQISFAEYEVLLPADSKLETFRHEFIASTYSVLPEPQASLGLGFLAGFRSLLPTQLTDDLAITGLTHIVAVSGYNTTIIASAIHSILNKRLSRFMVVCVTLLSLAGFLAITGLAPSVVRAFVVSTISLIAWYYGRRLKPSVLLLSAAAVTAWWTPLNYWFSLGWWLSFLAFFGVLILAPLLTARYFKTKPKLLRRIFIETTCAQIMTLPLIIWVFGKVSAVAILANLLVLPVIPLAMLATFIGGMSGLVLPELSFIIAWPARWILGYVTDIVSWLAQIPWALQTITLTERQMLIMYVFIGAISTLIYRRTQITKAKLYTLY